MKFKHLSLLLGIGCLGLGLGCAGTRTAGETAASQHLGEVGVRFRPGDRKPVLPRLDESSSLETLLRYAMLNQPAVEAAYFEWAASVQNITVERSPMDPRLTFGADITDTVMGLMTGVMTDLPGPGKLRLAAEVATEESTAAYFRFEQAVLQSAFALKSAYHRLHFLEARLAVLRQTLALLGNLEELARTQNQVGGGSLQDVIRIQLEQEGVSLEMANLEDSRSQLVAEFKAALGIPFNQEDPPVPVQFEQTPAGFTPEALFTAALERNPRLKAMEAEVRMAGAAIRLAYKARVPDFSVGLEVDLKASPLLFNPQAGLSLPVWKDKIAAQIAGSQSRQRAAEARLTAEQINLAVEFAALTFACRESARTLQLLDEKLLPKAGQALELARSAYGGGKSGFLDVIEAERTLLEFQLAAVDAGTRRELALAELSLLVLGLPPPGAPGVAPVRTNQNEDRP